MHNDSLTMNSNINSCGGDGDIKRAFPFGAVSNQPAIRVKPGVNMSVNRNVLRSLGNPKHIQFWWNSSEKVLLIGSASAEAPSSLGVSDYCYSRRGNMNLRNSVFINAIMAVTKWKNHVAYAVLGEYIPELGMVAFRVDDAVEMEMTANV